jgi:hypothetical protein
MPVWTIHKSYEDAHGHKACIPGLEGWWAVPDDPERDGSNIGPCATLGDLLDEMMAHVEAMEAAA